MVSREKEVYSTKFFKELKCSPSLSWKNSKKEFLKVIIKHQSMGKRLHKVIKIESNTNITNLIGFNLS